MKVLASPENKRIYTEDDIRQFVGLYHLGALNPTDDSVLTAIVLEELHKDNEEPQSIKRLSLKQKILKYTCLFIFAGFFLSLIIVLLYIACKLILVNFSITIQYPVILPKNRENDSRSEIDRLKLKIKRSSHV
jgi:hypothetical protein